ncbi:hypothetical protein ZWY2020_031426 [Hordeum vulgare]|nr:hypothetical protein ZWY2020_031426 [Hordeum vulgare]
MFTILIRIEFAMDLVVEHQAVVGVLGEPMEAAHRAEQGLAACPGSGSGSAPRVASSRSSLTNFSSTAWTSQDVVPTWSMGAGQLQRRWTREFKKEATTLEDTFEWDSDNEDFHDNKDVAEACHHHCFDIDILGFHPYKEILFLSHQSGSAHIDLDDERGGTRCIEDVLRHLVAPCWLAVSCCVCKAWRAIIDGDGLLCTELPFSAIFIAFTELPLPEFFSRPLRRYSLRSEASLTSLRRP